MRIAYIILAHKLPGQLVRLVERLISKDTSFFIHLDKRADKEIYNSVVEQLSIYDNVHFIKRHISKWGQLGCTKAVLGAINEIYSQSIEFDYVINLSGQDYPIKSNQYIKNVLQENRGLSFLNFYSIPNQSHKHLGDFI